MVLLTFIRRLTSIGERFDPNNDSQYSQKTLKSHVKPSTIWRNFGDFLIVFWEALESECQSITYPIDAKRRVNVSSIASIAAGRWGIILGTSPIDPAQFGARSVAPAAQPQNTFFFTVSVQY